jgi:hypothetical protein
VELFGSEIAMKAQSLISFLFIAIPGLLMLGQGAAHGQTPAPSMSDARRKVTAFEQKLRLLKDDQEKIQLARGFFAGLKDSESKIEAIGAIDSR